MSRFENKIERTEMDLACGNVAEELKGQDMADVANGAGASKQLGNNGGHCTLTNECQAICGMIGYSNRC